MMILRGFRRNAITREVLVLIGYATIALLALRVLLLTPGMLGRHWDWSIPTFPESLRNMTSLEFSAWFPIGLGSYVPYRYGSALPLAILGLPGYLGVSGEAVSKGLILMVTVIAGYGMFRFAREMPRRTPGASAGQGWASVGPWVAGMIFMLAPYQYNQIIAGDLLGLVAYAAAPHGATYLLRASDSDPRRYADAARAGLILGFVADCSIQPFLLTLAIVTPFAILVRQCSFGKLTARFGVIVAAMAASTAYWLVPALIGLHRTTEALVSTTGDPGLVAAGVSRYSSLTQALLGTAYFEPFFTEGIPAAFVGHWATFVLVAVAIMVVGLVLLIPGCPRSAWLVAGYWTVSYGVAVLLAAPGSVIGRPVRELYTLSPWEFLFRTPQHLVYLVPWCLAVLCSISLVSAGSRHIMPEFGRATKPVVLLGALAMTVGFFFAPDFQRYIGPSPTAPGERAVAALLAADPDPQGRLLSMPGGVDRLFGSHPIHDLSLEAGDDADVIWGTHSALAPELKWSPNAESRTFQRLVMDTLVRQPELAAPLLNMAAVKYVELTPFYSAAAGPDYLSYDRPTIEQRLDQLGSMTRLYSDGKWTLYRNEAYVGRVSVELGSASATGIDAALGAAVASATTNLSAQPLFVFPAPGNAEPDLVNLRPGLKASEATQVQLQGWTEVSSLKSEVSNYFDPYPAPIFRVSGSRADHHVLGFRFSVRQPGTYRIAAVALEGPAAPPLATSIDSAPSVLINLISARSVLQPLNIAAVHLGVGTHSLTMTALCSQSDPSQPCTAALLNIVVISESLRNSVESINPSFVSPNPGEYLGSLQIRKPGLLVLRDSFDEGWQAILGDGKGNETTPQHVVGSGFLNAWRIPSGSWKITLFFAPNRIYDRAIALSIAGMALLFAASVIWDIARIRNRPSVARASTNVPSQDGIKDSPISGGVETANDK